jgi:site-specific recombinase XerD
LTKRGKAAASQIKHAPIFLHVDANGSNWSDAHVAQALPCHGNTVRNVRQRLVAQGLEAALMRKKQRQPSRQRLLAGAKDALLITRAARKVSQVGGSLRDVQELAGHTSLAMTQRYIEGDTEAKRKLVALL